MFKFFSRENPGYPRKEKKDAIKRIQKYERVASKQLKTQIETIDTLLRNVTGWANVTMSKDRHKLYKDNIQQFCKGKSLDATLVPKYLLHALFYSFKDEDGDIQHFSFRKDGVIIQFLGLLRSREAVPVLMDILSFCLLEREINRTRTDVLDCLPWFPGDLEIDSIGFALGLIGDRQAIPILREARKEFGDDCGKMEYSLLLALCKLGGEEELKELMVKLSGNDVKNDVITAIGTALFFSPDVIRELKRLAADPKNKYILKNVETCLELSRVYQGM